MFRLARNWIAYVDSDEAIYFFVSLIIHTQTKLFFDENNVTITINSMTSCQQIDLDYKTSNMFAKNNLVSISPFVAQGRLKINVATQQHYRSKRQTLYINHLNTMQIFAKCNI